MKPDGYQKSLVPPALHSSWAPTEPETLILWPAGCPAYCRAADKAPTGTEPSPPTELDSARPWDPKVCLKHVGKQWDWISYWNMLETLIGSSFSIPFMSFPCFDMTGISHEKSVKTVSNVHLLKKCASRLSRYSTKLVDPQMPMSVHFSTCFAWCRCVWKCWISPPNGYLEVSNPWG